MGHTQQKLRKGQRENMITIIPILIITKSESEITPVSTYSEKDGNISKTICRLNHNHTSPHNMKLVRILPRTVELEVIEMDFKQATNIPNQI